ncbi:MAG: hypothetical protein Kow006_20740 [Gammaproteobacteria bacterium]
MSEEQTPQSMEEIMNPGVATRRDPDFPDAPLGWKRQQAEEQAAVHGLTLSEEHLELIRALQSYYRQHENRHINLRELHDALEERFHAKGGLKYLYGLIPSGPVTVGCHLAGLEPPAGSTDQGGGTTA